MRVLTFLTPPFDTPLFDVYPFACLLLALNERRVDWRLVVFGLFGVVINTLGARQFWV